MLRFISQKTATHHKLPTGRVFAWMALFNGMGAAAFAAIFPIILEEKFGSRSLVGGYFSLIAIVALMASLLATMIFQRFSKALVIKVMFSISVLFLVLMTFAEFAWQLGGLNIPKVLCIGVINLAMGLYVYEYSKKNELAIAEGRYYLFANIGWLIGPLLGGYVTKYFGDKSIFLLVSCCYLVAFVYFWHQHVVEKNPAVQEDSTPETFHMLFRHIKGFFHDRERVKVFGIVFGYNFWINLFLIFMPLVISSYGFGHDVVGWVLTCSILPFILLEELVGRAAQKYGVRNFIITGFAIITFCTVGLALGGAFPLLIIALFVLMNVGAACLEPLQETYFFHVVAPEEVHKYFGVYNISKPIAGLIGPMYAGAILAWNMGWGGMWAGIALVTFVFLGLALTIRVPVLEGAQVSEE